MTITTHPKRSTLLIYQVDPYEIHYLKFILEAYEGLATLTTLDPQKGLVQLAVPPGSSGILEGLMKALGPELKLKRISPTEECEERSFPQYAR
jgi:hypothetical protein